MLVRVDLVPDVAVGSVHVVVVVPVGDHGVPTAVPVHVHVTGMRQVRRGTGDRLVVHVSLVEAVGVAIVEVVHMIPVLHRCVSAA